MSQGGFIIEHMFDTQETATTDELEQALLAEEEAISRARARQVALIRALDRAQVATMDGCRSLAEWVASRLDLSPELARALVWAARALPDQPEVEEALREAECSFDRAVAVSRLEAAGLEGALERSRGWDLGAIGREAARRRRISSRQETEAYASRYLVIQPDLAQSTWRLWGLLPSADGRVVEEALDRRAECFPPLPEGGRGSLGQRRADALTSVCLDSLGADPEAAGEEAAPVLTVVAEASLLGASGGRAGAEIVAGPRIGLRALEELLCRGRVELDLRTADGGMVAVGETTRVIPPRVRRFVLGRDGGCRAEGCRSRYRLEVHHLRARSEGGDHHPGNLTTLCWFHHHVVVHGMGYRIDPHGPPGRWRFLPPPRGPGPPT